MSLIEGIDDEVTVLATCLLVLAIIVLAWASTHVDVRIHTSVIIVDRERFDELLRRIRGIMARAHETDTDVPSHSSAAAAETHSATDSLLVSGAAVDDAKDIKPQCSHDIGVDSHQSGDGEQKCLHESEAASSPDSTSSLLKCESASTSKSNTNCSESALSNQNAGPASVTSDMPPNSIQVRLQFVDGRQRTVFANPDDSIGSFKRYDCTCIL